MTRGRQLSSPDPSADVAASGSRVGGKEEKRLQKLFPTGDQRLK